MALIKCPECGSEISSSAASCPKCGYPIANKLSVNSGLGISIPNSSDSNNDVVNEPFPSLPTVMSVGSQITNWSLDAAIQDAYYLAEVNYTHYIKEGKVCVLAHTNGICIKSGFDFFYISHEQLIEMKFITHRQLTSENKSVIGRAVVGGVLLGPLAAVVGGLSGIGSKVKTIGNYLLVITFWDVYTHQVQTIFICTKVEYVNFINRVEKEKQNHNTPEGNNYVSNILDDAGKISDAKAIEALKVVGEMNLAKEIGYIEGCGEMTALQKVRDIGSRNQVDTSQYKSSGCMVTLLMIMTFLLSFMALFVVII